MIGDHVIIIVGSWCRDFLFGRRHIDNRSSQPILKLYKS
jgi:hypothetical protein